LENKLAGVQMVKRVATTMAILIVVPKEDQKLNFGGWAPESGVFFPGVTGDCCISIILSSFYQNPKLFFTCKVLGLTQAFTPCIKNT
jgi:hypothetical protein